MLNIPDLEKRWFHYKLKSYLPTFLIALLFIIGFSLVYTFFFRLSPTKNKKHIITHRISPEQNISHKKKRIPILVSPKKKEVKNRVIAPSMNFINQLKESITTSAYKPILTAKRKNKEEIKEMRKIVTKDKTTRTPNITIKKENTNKDIQNIIKRFQDDKNPALSLFLARKYYEIGNYKAAFKYALITNQLNKRIDESWIIFSKALVKMHHKDKAITILKQYIQSSQSTNAMILLHSIQTGTFQ